VGGEINSSKELHKLILKKYQEMTRLRALVYQLETHFEVLATKDFRMVRELIASNELNGLKDLIKGRPNVVILRALARKHSVKNYSRLNASELYKELLERGIKLCE